MRDFKRAIISTVAVVLAVILFSAAILLSPFAWHHDLDLRRELAGSLDFLIVGASHGQDALYTNGIDEALGCNSYNLSSDSLRSYEKKYFLQKELERNDVKTVVLEIAYDTMEKEYASRYVDSNVYSMARMETTCDRLTYYFNYIRNKNKAFVYSELMLRSAVSTVERIIGQPSIDEQMRKMKGSRLVHEKNYQLCGEDIVKNYNVNTFTTDNYTEDTIASFEKLIEMCKEERARVIVAVVPVSDNYLWEYKNMDDYKEWSEEWLNSLGVEYYDFNLLSERYELFSDNDCYSTDTHHMSAKGAEVFTKVFSEIIKEAGEGKDISSYFYKSYESLKNDSPYMEYYRSHK